MEQKTFYITTAIYYANSNLHVGHSYEIVLADAMARYKKLRGYDVKFLTGMDEHGQKVEQAALAKGITPQAHVDEIAQMVKTLFKDVLDIDYDIFIRTTDEKHKRAVAKIFKALYDKGDIYKSDYKGMYCIPDEAFYTEHQLKDGKCPVCDREVVPLKETAYFFKLSKYQDMLIKYIEENDDFIVPKSRQNEMLNNFLRPGLEDLCVSRTSFKWGIPVDFDPEHVVYVWLDALTNYITALDYLAEDGQALYDKYWPADIQLVGKDIVRFHTVIWPAILMALDEPLPKQVYGHGFLNIGGKKMGKSVGNVIDPKMLVERYGVDAVRYFLLREVVTGQDGNFTNEALVGRINADLANDLGNLLSRTVGMVEKYFGGKLPTAQVATDFDESLTQACAVAVAKAEEAYDNMHFSDALNEIWNFVRRANKYIDEVMPWALFKEEGKQDVLAGSLYMLAESLRIIAVLISPVMPNTPKTVYAQLNIADDGLKTWESTKEFGKLSRDVEVCKGDIVFPRIDIKKELEELEKL